MMLVALALARPDICPLIKNIWTSTFALFTGGFCLALLGLLMPVTEVPGVRQTLVPTRIFGENPLLAYIISFLIAPLIDYNWFGDATVSLSLRSGGQAWFEYFMEPRAASLTFGLCGLLFIFAILVICHRKRWILKL
jgi:predicted acyltransferase